MITDIFIYSLIMLSIAASTFTAFKSSELEKKIIELEKDIEVVRSEVRGRKGNK